MLAGPVKTNQQDSGKTKTMVLPHELVHFKFLGYDLSMSPYNIDDINATQRVAVTW